MTPSGRATPGCEAGTDAVDRRRMRRGLNRSRPRPARGATLGTRSSPVTRFLTLPRARATVHRSRVGEGADRRSRSVPAVRLGWGVLAALVLGLLAAGV